MRWVDEAGAAEAKEGYERAKEEYEEAMEAA